MFLMARLVSRSARSLAVMTGAATAGRGRAGDYVRGRPGRVHIPVAVFSRPQSAVLASRFISPFTE
jgi:hypothetical protein